MLRSCTREDIIKSSLRPYNKIRYEIEAFASSDAAFAEIDLSTYANPHSAYTTWLMSVRRLGLEQEIKILMNDHRVFIAHAWAL